MSRSVFAALLIAAAPAAFAAEEASVWDMISDNANAVGDSIVETFQGVEAPKTPESIPKAWDQAGDDTSALGDAIGELFGADETGAAPPEAASAEAATPGTAAAADAK